MLVILTSGILLFLIPGFEMAIHFRMERWFLPAVAPIMIGSLAAALYFSDENRLEKKIKSNGLVLVLCIVLFISPLFLPQSILMIFSYNSGFWYWIITALDYIESKFSFCEFIR